MIALCGEHHSKAEGGAFTLEQLKTFKVEANRNRGVIMGRFDWLRHRLLAVVGGNFYYETPIVFRFRNTPVVWFRKDRDGYLLLNLRMMSLSTEPRVIMEDNFWISKGAPSDLHCPPSGRLIHVQYPNDDELRIEFLELFSPHDIETRYPGAKPKDWVRLDPSLEFPITAVEVQNQIGGTEYGFGPRSTKLPGARFQNCFSGHCGCGLEMN
jgi:hypothetical protein